MIDEREITSSKLWRELQKVRRTHGLNEQTLVKLVLFLSACVFIVRKNESFGDISMSLRDRLFDLVRANQHSINTRYTRHWLELEQDLRHDLGAHTGILWIKSSDEVIQELLTPISKILSTINDVEYFFETAFRRHINNLNAYDFKISRKAAELASFLAPKSAGIIDFFIESGDFATLALYRRRTKRTVFSAVQPNEDFALRLRLAMHKISLVIERRLPKSDKSFILINHPQQVQSTRDSLENFDRETDTCALEGIDRLLQGQITFDLALAIVPGTDRSGTGLRKDIRSYIVDKHLVAVIDIPLSSAGAPRTVSAWLLSGKTLGARDILFVDASKPLKITGNGRTDEALKFVADIVHLWGGELTERKNSELSSRDFEGMFRHEFRDGYRDVPGLCKTVSFGEITRNNWTLKASRYIVEKVGRQSKLPTLDSNLVLDILSKADRPASRIYVIGNNGEGKSLLLSELVEHLGSLSIPTLGLSFGLTDRFPFSSRGAGAPRLFKYIGARTGAKAVALRSTNRMLIQYMKIIQTEQLRLDVFHEVMDLLGFRHSLFVVPSAYKSDDLSISRNVLSEAVMLTKSANKNAGLLEGKSLSNYSLGLMRKATRKEVVMFDELSSGEQQLLNLSIKLIASGKKDAVILVDEPEISLHVSWQRAIPEVFKIVSEELKCSIVVATHSPIVIASAVYREDYCFAAQNRTLLPISIKNNQSVDSVLFDDFRTYTRQTRRVHELCAAMVAKAIKRANSEAADFPVESNLDLLTELDGIVNIIQASPTGISHEQLSRDLSLVEKARAAIVEISRQY